MAERPDRAVRALEIVVLLRTGALPDQECATLLDELQRLIPHPTWLDLMFHQDPPLPDEAVIDAALSYRPFAL